MCTHRTYVERTVRILLFKTQILVNFYAAAGTVCKSSAHDVTLKIDVILPCFITHEFTPVQFHATCHRNKILSPQQKLTRYVKLAFFYNERSIEQYFQVILVNSVLVDVRKTLSYRWNACESSMLSGAVTTAWYHFSCILCACDGTATCEELVSLHAVFSERARARAGRKSYLGSVLLFLRVVQGVSLARFTKGKIEDNGSRTTEKKNSRIMK